MNIVPHHHHSCEATSSKIQQFFAEFHVGQILRSCNAYKLHGFAVMAIFLVAFEAAFQRRSFYQRKKDAPKSIPFERDTFYRFLNSCAIHWRKFTLLLGTAIIQKAIAPLTSEAEAGQRDKIYLLRRPDRSHGHCLRAVHNACFRVAAQHG